MSARVRLRDAFARYVPVWLAARPGFRTAFTVLWVLVASLDVLLEACVQGLNAFLPGVGTPTALPFHARNRGLLRGQSDTDESFALRLRAWLDRWATAGSSLSVALALHEFLANRPMVRAITRAGVWVTVHADGSVSRTRAAWDWDSVSNPERAGWWSEMWIVIYPTPWALRPGASLPALAGDDGHALGHLATHQEVDAVLGLITAWKSAHTLVRAVIWTSDRALFDPAVPSSLPNGTWGQWGGTGGGSRRAGGRNLTSCRYWEPR